MKRVLLVRLDKIGDLISTMCVDQAELLKGCDVRWVISKGLGFVPDHAEPRRTYIELSKEDWKTSLQNLRKFIREFKPEVAVSFQAPWWVGYALWAEGVPVRAGVQSQWHSFLFLNKGLRQRRSLATQHEADYNFDLLRYALDDTSARPATPILKLTAPTNPELLQKYGLTAQNYVVVHPGMAGSALNWPTANYIELIEKITPSTQVVLTGTPADEPFLKDIKAHFAKNSKVLSLQNLLKAPELFTVLKNAKAVVVPSTGVAHMAASLGTPTLGLYSPIRVQHPRRWAARGEKIQIFVRQNENPPYDNAMEEIKVDDLLKALSSL
ncbi:glycosyltransferase family 9 protein [Bdellovibrio svalbardensis]|uniref:Glycosyltransferase family 9 protein n=1 Tax=Bdellovibrio svalbardensis TaxID=2972972 RepID=A0ABT6DK23_9BACT|nr:glycosyltransferase family 9 protein [Bdellovibrio svalbardensis]MDG0816857.1 glycosyltransferase family 9 protein [Bdellovibrio svalbardensis]